MAYSGAISQFKLSAAGARQSVQIPTSDNNAVLTNMQVSFLHNGNTGGIVTDGNGAAYMRFATPQFSSPFDTCIQQYQGNGVNPADPSEDLYFAPGIYSAFLAFTSGMTNYKATIEGLDSTVITISPASMVTGYGLPLPDGIYYAAAVNNVTVQILETQVEPAFTLATTGLSGWRIIFDTVRLFGSSQAFIPGINFVAAEAETDFSQQAIFLSPCNYQ